MIKFYKGLKSKYNYPSNTGLQDAIYFAEDTGELLVNGMNYGIDTEKVKDVTKTGSELVFTLADGTTKKIDIGIDESTSAAIESLKGLLDENGKLNIDTLYHPGVDDELTVLEKVGGVAAGTTAASLKGKSLSSMFDEILFPTVQPTKIDPSVSIALKNGVSNTREIGSNAYEATDFTTTWNPGSIKIGSTVQNTRAGNKESEVVYATSESNGLPAKVVAGTTNYYYKVYYAKGPDPLDSKGNAASSLTALAAGNKTSSALATYGVYPFYATTTANNINEGTVTKLPLTNSTSFTCTLAAESATSKHVFKLPHNVTKIELKDPFGNWANQPLNEFPKTTESIDVNGTNVTYNVYTRNQGQNGSTEFRITYSK